MVSSGMLPAHSLIDFLVYFLQPLGRSETRLWRVEEGDNGVYLGVFIVNFGSWLCYSCFIIFFTIETLSIASSSDAFVAA